MLEDLSDEYPEATEYIRDALDEHGVEWVLENYYIEIYPLSKVMSVPEKDELPFYKEEKHEDMTKEERKEMYRCWDIYRENLCSNSKEKQE